MIEEGALLNTTLVNSTLPATCQFWRGFPWLSLQATRQTRFPHWQSILLWVSGGGVQEGGVPVGCPGHERCSGEPDGDGCDDLEDGRKAAHEIGAEGKNGGTDGGAADEDRVGHAADGTVVRSTKVVGVGGAEQGLLHALRHTEGSSIRPDLDGRVYDRQQTDHASEEDEEHTQKETGRRMVHEPSRPEIGDRRDYAQGNKKLSGQIALRRPLPGWRSGGRGARSQTRPCRPLRS